MPATPRQAATRRGPLDRALDPELFKALSDPTRAKLLACLAKCSRACTVSEVAACCSVDFSVVARHLQTLERAGVVGAEKAGRSVLYRVRYGEVCGALRGLADALERCCGSDRACGGDCGGDGCGAGGEACVCAPGSRVACVDG